MKKERFYILNGLILALVFVLVMGGCAQTATTTQDTEKALTSQEMVAEAKSKICEVSVSEAKELLDKGGVIFIDCREPKEFKMGHVPGAINIPRGLLEFKIEKKVPEKDTQIIMYCKKGGRGCLASFCLCRMGYTNARNMDGGWMAWEKAGFPIE